MFLPAAYVETHTQNNLSSSIVALLVAADATTSTSADDTVADEWSNTLNPSMTVLSIHPERKEKTIRKSPITLPNCFKHIYFKATSTATTLSVRFRGNRTNVQISLEKFLESETTDQVGIKYSRHICS